MLTGPRTIKATSADNICNHIGFVIDESGSMYGHRYTVHKVIDAQVKHLAETSRQNGQETRVSVWTFNRATNIRCLIWDQDVLRHPSIAGRYLPTDGTALLDATAAAISDLQEVATRHGDHAFLLYIITDGHENESRSTTPAGMKGLLEGLPEEWTVGIFVPDILGVKAAKGFGFPANNIAIWATTTAEGIAEVSETITATTTSYMTSRASGIRGTKNLFNLNTGAATVDAVKALGIQPLKYGTYSLSPIAGIPDKTQVSAYVASIGLLFKLGSVYYQLSKPEKIGANKMIALVDKKTDEVFLGREARTLLGLPDYEVRVAPATADKYWVMVQSNSTNRHLVAHTKLLIVN